MIEVMEDKRILCVGLCCLDIFNICKDYPKEDTDQRTLDYYWQRGGNASNTCSVLSLLGSNCELLATLAESKEYSFMSEDLHEFGIKYDNCVVHKDCSTPISTVIINARNGTRTILFSKKNLPELTFEDFKRLNFKDGIQYKWVHFETRPIFDEIKKMLEHLKECNEQLDENQRIITSLELEKSERSKFCNLIHLLDVLFVSKDFAMHYGYNDMETAVKEFKKQCGAETTVICAWGEKGAAAIGTDGVIVHSPAFTPAEVVDTLGAGDTFIAAVVHSLMDNRTTIKEAITFGCRVAGAKVGMRGYKDLVKFQNLRQC